MEPQARIMQLIATLEGVWYRRSEIATLCGVQPMTVWLAGARHPELAAKHYAVIEGRKTHLYTEAERAALVAYHASTRRGRRPAVSPQESGRRAQIMERARWHRRQAKRLASEGKPLAAMQSVRTADQIERDL